jgi:N-acetylneuraminic acid mutarotase
VIETRGVTDLNHGHGSVTWSSRVGVAVAVTSLLVAACGNGTGETTASPATTAGPTTTEAEEVPSGPSARGYHRLVYVGGDLGVLLLGGFTGIGPPSAIPRITTTDAAWSFTPAVGWTDLGLVGYEEMPTLNDAVYHADSGRVVLISMGVTAQLPRLISATYLYDPTTGEVEPMAAEGPLALIGARAAYDSESDRVIVFGGLTFGSREIDDTWAYDIDTDTWTQMSPTVSPPPRNYHAMAYHPGLDRVVLFGGCCGGSDQPPDGLGDTWVYDYNTDTWTEVASATGPGPRYYHAMVHDPVTDGLILFGGVTGRAEAPLDDTWAFDVAMETWTQLSAAPTPSPRGWHAMAHDPDAGVIVLFGGGVRKGAYIDETWLYDPVANTWTEVR